MVSTNGSSKRKPRVKFPVTRRERLSGLAASTTSSLVPRRHLSIQGDIHAESFGDVSIPPSMPRTSSNRWQQDSMADAAPDQSWGDWAQQQGQAGQTGGGHNVSFARPDGLPLPEEEPLAPDQDALDKSEKPAATSPSTPSRVVFAPFEEDDEVFRRQVSHGESFAIMDNVSIGMYGRGPYNPALSSIQEVDHSQLAGSLIGWGQETASGWDMLFAFLGIVGYLWDVGSDCLVAFEYASTKYYVFFALTMSFILLPSLAMTIFSLVLWVQNAHMLKETISPWQWIFRALSLVFMLSPVMRLVEILYYAFQSRYGQKDWYQRRKFYERMLDEYTDVNLVRLFETFLENAPQLVLQLYVMTTIGAKEGILLVVLQCVSLLSSWIMMTVSMVSFQTALRDSLPDKARLTFPGKAGMFFWRLFTIAARVIALALFASYFHFYVLIFMGAHFMIMFMWVAKQKTVYCQFKVRKEDGSSEVHHSEFLEFCFRFVAAFVHIFCFFNLLEGHTRLRCLAYYCLIYAENVAMVFMWYISGSSESSADWYHAPAMFMVLGGFFIGIAFQILYYKTCHPNNISPAHSEFKIKNCVPFSEMSLFNSIGGIPEKTNLDDTEEGHPLQNQLPPGSDTQMQMFYPEWNGNYKQGDPFHNGRQRFDRIGDARANGQDMNVSRQSSVSQGQQPVRQFHPVQPVIPKPREDEAEPQPAPKKKKVPTATLR